MTTFPPRPAADDNAAIPPFEPITDLDDYAFVFAQKGFNDSTGPVLWLSERANPYMVAVALRVMAREIERGADGHYPDSDRAAAHHYATTPAPLLRGRQP